MRLEKLTVNAFLCFAAETQIDFTKLGNSCLYLITGETGAGKTTIFDAISFALFGKASGDSRSDALTLRSDFVTNKTPTSVELIFVLANDKYKVKRVITPSKSEAYLTIANEQIIASGVRNVTQKIEEIIGLNREQFAQIIMIAQNDFLRFLKSNTTDRQKILRKIFNTQLLQSLQEHLKLKTKTLTYDLENLKAQFTKLDVNFYTRHEQVSEKITILKDLKIELEKVRDIINKRKLNKDKLLFQLGQAEQLNKHFSALDNLRIALTSYEQEEVTMQNLATKIKLSKLYLRHVSPLETEIATLQSNFTDAVCSYNAYTEKQLLINNAGTELKQVYADLPNITAQEQSSSDLKQKINSADIKIKQLTTLQKDYEYIIKQTAQLEEKQNILQQYLNAQQKINTIADDLTNRLQVLTENITIQTEKKVFLEKIEELLLNIQTKTALLRKNQVHFEHVNEKYTELNNNIKAGETFLLRKQAGFLAKTLKENEPCPVCGATEHPQKASLPKAGIYTAEKVAALQEEETVLRNKREKIATICSQIQAEINILQEQLLKLKSNIFITTNYEELTKKTGQSLINTSNQINYFHKHKQKLQKKRAKIITNSQNLQTKITTSQKLCLQLETIITNQTENLNERAREIPQLQPFRFPKLNKALTSEIKKTSAIYTLYLEIRHMKKHYLSTCLHFFKLLENNINKLETDLATVTALKHSALETLNKQKLKLEKTQKQLSLVLLTHNLQTQKQVDLQYFTETELIASEQKLQKFEQEFNYTLKEKIRLEAEIATKIRPDITKLEAQIDTLDQELTVSEHDYETILLKINNHEEQIAKLQVLIKETAVIEEQYNLIDPLAQVANGPLDLETYAQATYFDQIIIRANKRLAIMSQNRYKLIRQKDITNKKRATGLELVVFDHYTMRLRTTNSLSGGESFITSLSLALGLADIVQQNIGGTYLETMFIDEGFGTLDSESLELALNTLANISDSKRTIGIISHVTELRAKIKKQIIVEKHYAGSKIKLLT